MSYKSIGIEPFCGIENPGQTCFANSVIQLLWRIPEFKKCVLDPVDNTSTDLMKSFKPFFKRLGSKTRDDSQQSIRFTDDEWISFFNEIEKTATGSNPEPFGVKKDYKGEVKKNKHGSIEYKQEGAEDFLNKIIDNIG
jgi:uncharacterized UBP type Zn finger protein